MYNMDKFSNVWKLMESYELQLDTDITAELRCTICKKLMINACNSPCGCRFCKTCITTFLNNDQKLCPGDSDECKDELLKINENINIDQAVNNKISKLIVKCPFKTCDFQTELKKMDDHIRVCNNRPTKCPYFNIGCSENQLIVNEIKDHLVSNDYQHTMLLSEWIDNINNETELLQKAVIELTDITVDLKSEINSLKSKIEVNQQQEISENENLETSENSERSELHMRKKDKLIRLNTSPEHEFQWQIENVMEKQSDAKAGINVEIFSESFYIYQPGYKICFVFLPNGFANEEGYVGLGFCLMRGVYDPFLSWPFKHSVTFNIINQSNGLIHKELIIRFEDDPFTDDWSKPRMEKNDANGVSKFLKQSELRDTDGLCVNDRIVINCVFDKANC